MGKNNIIKDVYAYFTTELHKNLEINVDSDTYHKIVKPYLNRKLVKSLLMPMIYGKAVQGMSKDIYLYYDTILGLKESSVIASQDNL